ncbi:MAG: nucleotide exchange factor GrpE [Bacteroidota bacterium]|jgi:molecular chaperone GrpE|nr:nucleotide exchange factor GrpE [Ignavibacteria bacterium]HEX2961996.1 nucleotide exchange factor GrpE [Ignavibacteriales bacterium]MCU7499110.1 nucleotide exchange factor GrpE [Ignavibacteria bacterium]MCU7513993.1 nucleotide exchange factor GrpE [Ignavibacteria bacterium]MCU7521535.1 nucleotide exchange factor GrpE [Ignavibacteria bacterium]
MKDKKEEKNRENESHQIKVERGTKGSAPKNVHEEKGEQDIKGANQNANSADNVTAEQLAQAIVESTEFKALREESENLTKEVAELKDKLLRRAAEFENYKRRTEQEQLNWLKYAAESFIVKILPVYDDLERSLAHAKDANNVDAIKEGLNMVLNKFSKVLEEQGVKKIDAKGKPFDFNFHEALLQQNVPGIAPHTVIEVVEPGYIYKDKVIRHAKVIVSDENSSAETK